MRLPPPRLELDSCADRPTAPTTPCFGAVGAREHVRLAAAVCTTVGGTKEDPGPSFVRGRPSPARWPSPRRRRVRGRVAGVSWARWRTCSPSGISRARARSRGVWPQTGTCSGTTGSCGDARPRPDRRRRVGSGQTRAPHLLHRASQRVRALAVYSVSMLGLGRPHLRSSAPRPDTDRSARRIRHHRSIGGRLCLGTARRRSGTPWGHGPQGRLSPYSAGAIASTDSRAAARISSDSSPGPTPRATRTAPTRALSAAAARLRSPSSASRCTRYRCTWPE